MASKMLLLRNMKNSRSQSSAEQFLKKFGLCLFIVTLIHSRDAKSQSVTVAISNQGDTLHLEFSGQSNWNYDLKKTESKTGPVYNLTVPAISEKAKAGLMSFKSPLIKKIEVDPQGPDGTHVLKFFAVNNTVEAFDYLTDQPSRLIVDLFKNEIKKPGSGANEKSAATALPKKNLGDKTKQEIVKTVTTAQADARTDDEFSTPEDGGDVTRAPASPDVLTVNPMAPLDSPASPLVKKEGEDKKSGIFDGGDPNFERFSIKDYDVKEEAVIASRENIYLEFPPLKMQNNFLSTLLSKKPIYSILPKDTEENKQARLLVTLFENKRYNVFLKTVDWFFKKYPETEYEEIIRFMWADAHFALWVEKRDFNEFDVAMLRYRQALEKFPDSPLIERTRMLMGFATMDRGDYLGTLRMFQGHIKNRPNSPNKDIARLAIAESLLKLNKYDEAMKELQEIEANASDKTYSVEATFLMGDVPFQKKDWTSAIELYKRAQNKFPESTQKYPNAMYNQAAAYFWNQDYRKSLEGYGQFLRNFPSHPFAGYAMTRVGELLDILGADKTRVMGAYLETYFRYGETPSSIVARLRLLSNRMPTMKQKEVEKAVNDIEQLAKISDLPHIEQFAKIMIADGYAKRGEYDKSVDLAVKYYQANPTKADFELLSSRIRKYINEDLRERVDKGDYIEALRLHNKYATSWLKGTNRMDTKYNVGRAFEQAGVFSEAETLYKDTLNKLYSIKGTTAEKERNIFEKIPSTDEINLRLASVSDKEGKYNQAYDYLRDIKKPESLSEVDQIERVQMAADLLDRKGDSETAMRYLVELIKTWKGIPALVAEPYFKLAQLEVKQGKNSDAMESLRKVDGLMLDSGKVNAVTHAKALELLGDLQLKDKKTDEAKSTYANLLEKYEKSRPLQSIRYRLGMLYFEQGQIQKAAEIWNPLTSESTSFWGKMAQEQLSNSNWSDSYKKYIQRIPAMSEGTKK